MPVIYPLFSSSKGNCTYIGTRERGVLIDCGVSCKRLCEAMELSGLSFGAVKGILITHEHSDHIKGLSLLTKKTGIPVYSRTATLDILSDKGIVFSQMHDIDESAEVGGMEISCFPVSHDAAAPCGYRIHFTHDGDCAVCTDSGYVSEKMRTALSGVKAIILESNYDERMLRMGGYPASLKERILSERGHLSNADSGEFAAELVKGGAVRIILGHLSEENNTPAHAEYAVESRIAESGMQRGRDYLLSVAAVRTDGSFIQY